MLDVDILCIVLLQVRVVHIAILSCIMSSVLAMMIIMEMVVV